MNNRPINQPSVPGGRAYSWVGHPCAPSLRYAQAHTDTKHRQQITRSHGCVSTLPHCTPLRHRYVLLFTHAPFPTDVCSKSCARRLFVCNRGQPVRCSTRCAHGARQVRGACSSPVTLPRAQLFALLPVAVCMNGAEHSPSFPAPRFLFSARRCPYTPQWASVTPPGAPRRNSTPPPLGSPRGTAGCTPRSTGWMW